MIIEIPGSIISQKFSITSPGQLVITFITKLASNRLLPKTKVQAWLRTLAFRRAVGRAFTKFAIRHPRWADSCFDEYFVQHVAAWLLAYYIRQPAVPPSPVELASLWVEQFRVADPAQYVVKVTPVAANFLALLEAEYNGIERN